MFPIPFNFPFINKNGTRTTIGEAIGAGGGGSYTLPTASGSTKGGVKIGDGLTMTGEKLSADKQIPVYSVSQAGKVLLVNGEGSLEWGTVSGGGGNAKTLLTATHSTPDIEAKEVTT